MRDYLEELLEQLSAEDWDEETAQWLQREIFIFPIAERNPRISGRNSELLSDSDFGPLASAAANFTLWPEQQAWQNPAASNPKETGLPELPDSSDWTQPLVPVQGPENDVLSYSLSLFPGEGTQTQRLAMLSPQRDGDPRPALWEQSQALERASRQVPVQQAQTRSASDFSSLPPQGRELRSSAGALSHENSRALPAQLFQAHHAAADDSARAVDRACQRDSRRYDRGFSLY